MAVRKGDRYEQTRSGRVVVILDPEYEDGCVSWYYEDGGGSGERNWHYCFADSFIWGSEYKKLGVSS